MLPGHIFKLVAETELAEKNVPHWLAWREYGNAAGFPVLFFHGNLDSRLFEPAWDKTLTQAQTHQAGTDLINPNSIISYYGHAIKFAQPYTRLDRKCKSSNEADIRIV